MAGFLDGLLADPADVKGAMSRAEPRDPEYIRCRRFDPVSSDGAEVPSLRGVRHEPLQAVKIA
jgi:hypothetical protein